MIFDSTNKFSASQAITVTAASTNVIDLGVGLRDVGIGDTIPLFVGVDADFATLDSLVVNVETSVDEAFSSPIVVVSTGAIVVGDLVAGYQFNVDRITKGVEGRYLRLSYTVAGSAATAGSITAGITAGNQSNA